MTVPYILFAEAILGSFEFILLNRQFFYQCSEGLFSVFKAYWLMRVNGAWRSKTSITAFQIPYVIMFFT